jgi:SAM-dependent methyltransferase
MEIPGHGLVTGEWDLRAGVEDYLGHVQLRGKRVLEIGTASGFLCFHMERAGAEVVSYDLAPDRDWDLVPFARLDLLPSRAWRKEHVERVKNGYWYAHHAHGSRARVVYGTVYDVPLEIGSVDVSTFGSVLLHVRDPFLALQSALRLTRETVVVTELLQPPGLLDRLLGRHDRPAMEFLPDAAKCRPEETWWRMPSGVLQAFLAVLGFERSTVTHHTQAYKGRSKPLYTVVAHRTHGSPAPMVSPP